MGGRGGRPAASRWPCGTSGLADPVAHVLRHGTGPAARMAAAEEAERLWARGVAARAALRPEYGGRAVLVLTAPVRKRQSGVTSSRS
ncbi:hypothetical protein ACFYMX_16935 [Streptomyces griseofuscus]|uniref:hypothetical protein n=1 Tax=Streptomyces TaxID=1883 RepID=UPI0018F0D0D2|nr:hypothetical protein [Streptomyces sp. CRPSP2-6A1]MBJ7005154.1 hypothetical protein [Streptomyces sp. CRPSP2-6A1]